jgi:hypothetical protein
MELEKIKNYLQNYLDTVLLPRVNKERSEKDEEPIKLSIHSLLKGSYQPPIIHVFIDSEPELKKSISVMPQSVLMLAGIEKDITDFLKIFSINYRVKVHWNKRPIFKNDTLHTKD